VYDERLASTCGVWRPVVGQVADTFLTCGVLDHGFARIRGGSATTPADERAEADCCASAVSERDHAGGLVNSTDSLAAGLSMNLEIGAADTTR
jgi:hypothetical protein